MRDQDDIWRKIDAALAYATIAYAVAMGIIIMTTWLIARMLGF